MTDLEIARGFFSMLRKHGACIHEKEDQVKGETVFEIIPHLFRDNDTTTMAFSFKAGEYQRMDGYAGGRHGTFYLKKVHQRGWQS